MLKESKKIQYSAKIIKAISEGRDSTEGILETIPENHPYLLKIITEIKKIGLVSKEGKYLELTKPVSDIMVADVLIPDALDTTDKLVYVYLKTVKISDVW